MRCVVVAAHDARDAALIERVLGEYREMPGLALTLDQAQPLWGCDAVTGRRIADVLMERRRTLVMFPILVVMYARLARREERDVRAQCGRAWDVYASGTSAFVPRLRDRAQAPAKHSS